MFLEGYKTILANVVGVGATVVYTKYGIEVDSGTQTAIVGTIFGVINIGLRFMTKGKVGEKRS